MNKYLVVILMTMGLMSCTSKNEQYYRSNPKALQNAVNACPNHQPPGLSCQQLEQLRDRLTHLAYQLQMNPQDFGRKILELQQTIAKQKEQVTQNSHDNELHASLEQNQHHLADYLAVVKWLESPES